MFLWVEDQYVVCLHLPEPETDGYTFKTTFDFNAPLLKWWIKISSKKHYEIMGFISRHLIHTHT